MDLSISSTRHVILQTGALNKAVSLIHDNGVGLSRVVLSYRRLAVLIRKMWQCPPLANPFLDTALLIEHIGGDIFVTMDLPTNALRIGYFKIIDNTMTPVGEDFRVYESEWVRFRRVLEKLANSDSLMLYAVRPCSETWEHYNALITGSCPECHPFGMTNLQIRLRLKGE
jgi:hypothetical protein